MCRSWQFLTCWVLVSHVFSRGIMLHNSEPEASPCPYCNLTSRSDSPHHGGLKPEACFTQIESVSRRREDCSSKFRPEHGDIITRAC